MKRLNTKKNEGQKKPRMAREQYGVLGIIESVSLQNFMCHDNLKFDFHPHMNFIIGQNGSGKSAILTGIILALGGKSSSTGRYGNIKGFIKTNKHTSTISVTLKNCGPNAYKPDVYGEKVVVDRILHSSGSAMYKIKSEHGQVVSTTKEELRNILECLGIQIENPTSILTQEISRNFLLSKNAKMLFQLFYEGTNLKKVDDEYQASIKHSNDTLQEIEVKKLLLPEMEKEVKRLKTYLESSEKIPDYRNELLWAGVIELEKVRDARKQELEKEKQHLSSLNEKLNRHKNEIIDINHHIDKFSKDVEESKLLIPKYREEVKTLSAQRDKINSTIREYQGTIERLSREIKRRNEEISNLENSINEIRQKNENTINENKRVEEERIKKLSNDVIILNQDIGNLFERHKLTADNAGSFQQKIDSLNQVIVSLNHKITDTERDYIQLTKGKSDRLNVYGTEMTLICAEISRSVSAGYFKQTPKGPIGAYIRVKNPIWSFAVQCCLNEYLLKSFCCDNHEDAEKLREIFSRHCRSRKPSTFTSKYLPQVHNVKQFKPVTNYPTLLDLLEISDPVIANCLIDQRSIESIIMIENASEASEYMMRSPPKYCSVAYTVNGDQIYANPYRSYPCRKKRDKIYLLKTIDDNDISNKKQLLENLVKERQEKQQFLISFRSDYTNLCEEIKILQMEFSEKKGQLRLKEDHLRKAKEKLNIHTEQIDVNGMLGDLNELQREREVAEFELAEVKHSLHVKEAELNVLNITAKRHQLDKESAKYSALSNKLLESETKKANLEMKIKKYESEVSNLTSSIEVLSKSYKESADYAKISESNAKQICPRIKTSRSSETITKMLEEMEKALQKETNFSRETLREQYEEKLRKWNNFKKELETMELTVTRLHKMLEDRKKGFLNIRKNTALCLSLLFTTTLKKNKFVGALEVSFENKELNIIARPEKYGNKGGKNYHQLSGGERSFITIAFLLTLWERVEMPFRILDEYDVFMDANNRHLSVTLLIEYAKTNKDVQYVFLSPLDLPPMGDDVNIKIHKMPAPKRKRTHSEL